MSAVRAIKLIRMFGALGQVAAEQAITRFSGPFEPPRTAGRSGRRGLSAVQFAAAVKHLPSL